MRKTGSTAVVVILAFVAIVVIVASVLNVGPSAEPLPISSGAQAAAQVATSTDIPDPCARENIQTTLREFGKLSREFRDAFDLAQSTPPLKLSPMIAQMQEIRRRAEDHAIPPCLYTLQEYQLGFMNTAIDIALMLYSSFSGAPDQTLTEEQTDTLVAEVDRRMAQANEYQDRYMIEMARLLGIPLTPSATVDPAGVPTSIEVTTTP